MSLLLATSGATAETRAGAAAIEIATPSGVPLAGYGARGPGNTSLGVAEPVSARALVLERDAGQRVAILVLDALIVTPEVRAAIADATSDLRIDTLVVAATHTHSGAGGYIDDTVTEVAILGWYQRESRDAVLTAASKALAKAVAALAPAALTLAHADGDTLARNRRHEGGPRDPRVPILAVDTPDGAPIATLFALAAHPTVFAPNNLRVSPDYPGAARRRVEARRGGVGIFLAGPLGDQKPHFEGEPEWPDDVGRQERTAKLIGDALGNRVADALVGRTGQEDAPISALTREWTLPPIDVLDSCAYWIGTPLLHLVARGFLPETAPMTALRLGKLRLLASPFELGVEVADLVRQRTGAEADLLVAAHANAWLGYLLLPDDYDSGGYEPCMAYHGRELAPHFVDEAAKVLQALP